MPPRLALLAVALFIVEFFDAPTIANLFAFISIFLLCSSLKRLANPGSLFGPSPVGAIGHAIKSHGFVCFSEAAGQSGRPSRIGTVTTPPAVNKYLSLKLKLSLPVGVMPDRWECR
jgi:hypothetical protein